MSEKIRNLSQMIVHQSLKVKENEMVLIQYQSLYAKELVKQLILDLQTINASVCVRFHDPSLDALLKEKANEGYVFLAQEGAKYDVEHFDCFIHIKYTINDYEEKKVSSLVRKKIGEATEVYDDIRINQKRWVLLNYPSLVDAHKAKMPYEDFCSFALNVMTLDYQKMHENMKPLIELMEQTDQVHIKAPNTDLTFSIKGMPAIPCYGMSNIPDGEIYTAPIKDSVNGTLTYNTPSPYQGNVYHQVSLTFENGKIVKATCQEGEEALNAIFDIDEGARYIGEFAIGLNPLILHPMGDILYDEKIKGSIHFTPGRAYRDADNGNKSSIHWDMVLIERSEYGGGELYFDDVLIRKDGQFLLPSLEPLNYREF